MLSFIDSQANLSENGSDHVNPRNSIIPKCEGCTGVETTILLYSALLWYDNLISPTPLLQHIFYHVNLCPYKPSFRRIFPGNVSSLCFLKRAWEFFSKTGYVGVDYVLVRRRCCGTVFPVSLPRTVSPAIVRFVFHFEVEIDLRIVIS